MGTHPIFESDFDCLTDFENKKIMDAEYEAIQRARMAQMQRGQGDEQKRQQMEEMTNSMLGQLLDQSARARLNNLALVNPTKAKQVEAMLMQMARQGQITSKMNEAALADILAKIPSEQKKPVKFERRKILDSDSE